MITVAQAGKALGRTPSRIRQLIGEGRMRAEKVAGVWILKGLSVKSVKQGRPRSNGK